MKIDLKSGAVVLAACSACQVAQAGIYISTGTGGAQIQCDIAHIHHWTYSVSQDTSEVSGGLFMMKAGSQTTASVSFSIFEGEFSAFGMATPLLQSTLTPSAFTQSFNWIDFSAPAITLLAGRVYTAVLYSDAADSQNYAYFLKGGSNTSLGFVDENGAPNSSGGSIVPPVPTPGTLALLGMAGLASRRRRR